MKKLFTLLFLSMASLASLPAKDTICCGDVEYITDIYKFTMSLNVPRVYDNMTSKGNRKYHKDKFEGILRIKYPVDESARGQISIEALYNKSHKVNGMNVTYDVIVDDGTIVYPRVNLLGDNKTGKFKTPSVVFFACCDPSYNIGEVDEDNTLYIMLAGKGLVSQNKRKGCQVISSLSGYVSGSIGCGCYAYGHVSPTRINGVCGPIRGYVDDVAAVWGTWKATYKSSICSK